MNYLSKLPNSLEYLNINEFRNKIFPNLFKNILSLQSPFYKLIDLPSNLLELYCDNILLSSFINTHLPDKLTHLSCNNNPLDYLPNLPKNLIYLSCNNININYIPDQLPNKLLYLYYDNNPIKILPTYIPENLEILSLNNCSLTNIFKLPNSIVNLYLNDNNINKIDNLPLSLEILECKNNKIKLLPQIPDSLNLLNCDNNPLKYIPNVPDNCEIIYNGFLYYFIGEYKKNIKINGEINIHNYGNISSLNDFKNYIYKIKNKS